MIIFLQIQIFNLQTNESYVNWNEYLCFKISELNDKK